LAVLFLTQLPFDRIVRLDSWTRWLLLGGVALDGLAALLYFRYQNRVHLARLQMADCLRSLDADTAKEIWAGTGQVWKKYGKLYVAGDACFGASILALGVVLTELLRLTS
jgi:hypothetical protein